MKKFHLLFILTVSLVFHSLSSYAVSAYPYPFQYTQPDGSVVTIQLKGDEKVHWAETADGYKLLSNGKNGWEYAVVNKDGDIQCSGSLAREQGKRSLADRRLLSGVSKNIRYSDKQVKLLKSLWDARHALDKTSGGFNMQGNSNLTGSSLQKSPGISKVFSPVGGKKLLMILIGFTDKAFTKTQADFYNLMNQVGYNLNGAAGSVKDYFLETSYNQFNVTTTVAGPYTAAHNMSYYGANDSNGYDVNPGALITEAVTLADADVNYADFDNDGDGIVDGVYVVYAGYGEASGAPSYTIWPHASSIPTITCDGVKISRYSCSNELQGTTGTSMTTIGVICHEFGHMGGALDYYDTNYATSGQYDGMGAWDLMSSGNWNGSPAGCRPSHMNPYDKIRCNWVTPTLLATDASVTLGDIKSNPVVYRYNTTTPNEYFLLENRQRTGFNASVPGHGLMIYHVDGDYITAHTSANDINAGVHQGMLPMAATATAANGVMTGVINTAGCPWPGTGNKTTFTDSTTPNSQSWAGANTNGALLNITENSGVISLCYKSCPAVNPVFNVMASAVNASQINLSWVNNAANNDIIVASNSTNTFGTPTNGTTYNVGDVLPGGGTVLFKGPGSAFNHTGLSASTTYYYQIWAVDGTLTYSGGTATSTKTLCNSTVTLPFNEGFENGISGCWTQENVQGVNPWGVTTSGVNYHPVVAHNGNNMAYCRDISDYWAPVTKLISPPLNLAGTSNPVLKFWHTQEFWGGQDILRVYYRVSGTGNWNLLATYTSSLASWTLETVSLPNPADNYFIAFEATGNVGYGVYLDDVEVESADCVAGTWLGTVSSNWSDAGNWCGSVPASTTDVVIPSGTPFSPSINANGAACRKLTINNGATLSMNASTLYTLYVAGDWTNNGTFIPGKGKVKFNGSNTLQSIGGSSTTTFNILSLSKGAQNRILEVTSPIVLSAATDPLELLSGTLKLSVASTITPFTTDGYTLSTYGGIWNNGGTINLPTNIFISGLLRNTIGTTNGYYVKYSGNSSALAMEGGTLNVQSRISPNVAVTDITNYTQSGGTVNVNSAGSASTSFAPVDITSGSSFTMSGGNIIIQNTSSFTSDYQNLATANAITGGTLQIGNPATSGSPVVRINSTAPVYNLAVNATGTPSVQLLSNLTVLNDINLGLGTKLDANNFNIAVAGNWTNNGGSLATPLSGTVVFNGNSAQNILGSATTAFNNLTLNNSNGLTLGSNTTVNGVLNFSSGVISTGNNMLIIPASGSVSRTSGHVSGNLQKTIPTGANVGTVFELGDNALANYTPLTVTMASVTTSGSLVAKTVLGNEPHIATSTLYPSVSINRYWTLANVGVGFTTYDAAFTYLPGDIAASLNTSNILAGEYGSSAWTYPAVASKTSSSTLLTGLNSFGDFQLAEGCPQLTTPAFDAVAAICSGSSLNALPTTSSNGITGTWSPALNNMQTTVYTFTPAAGQCATTATMTITVNPLVTPTFDAVADICSGSSLNALPTTSSNGITGTWSPALNNTQTTVYTFTPAAGQCATTATMTITVNPLVTPTFDAVAAICSGSSLNALPTISNNGIAGTWTPALNNTQTTVYTFTPAAGQCATAATMTITVNPLVTPTFDAVAAICSGSSLNALPTTSNNGITGTWSPALNNTQTTVYTFTPAAGQCATTATMIITVNPLVMPTFDAVAAICSGSSLNALPTISNNGIAGTWTPALNNLQTTVYTFTPTAGQCAATATMTITVNAKPVTPVITQNGKILSSDAPAGNQWYDQNGAISGATNQSYTTTTNGTYYTIVTLNGCSSAMSNSIPVLLTGVEGVGDGRIANVFPNPVSNELNIEMTGNAERLNVEILNGIGQVVYRGNFVEKTTVNTSQFNPGVYLIKIESGKTFEFKKIIKR
jgi:M6 family metalloprotease domain